MRVFRGSYGNKQGETHQTATWYVQFRDHRQGIRRVAGFPDRKATVELGRKIERLAWARGSGDTLDPVLTKWVEGLSPRLRKFLGRIGLLDAAKVASLRPLSEHVEGAKDAPGWRQHLAAKGNTAQHVDTSCSRVLKVIEGCKFAY